MSFCIFLWRNTIFNFNLICEYKEQSYNLNFEVAYKEVSEYLKKWDNNIFYNDETNDYGINHFQ